MTPQKATTRLIGIRTISFTLLPLLIMTQQVYAQDSHSNVPGMNLPSQSIPSTSRNVFSTDTVVNVPRINGNDHLSVPPQPTAANRNFGYRVSGESDLLDILVRETKTLTSREGSGSSIKLVLFLGALSLAPAILLMTTCYVRIVVVLTLLRQAFGGQQLPPNQVLTALSLFLTLLVMTPVWNEVKMEAIDPYSDSQSIDWREAWNRGIVPIKRFMGRQIKIAKNTNSIEVFYKYAEDLNDVEPPSNIEDVPVTVLLPAFIVSELKVAFLLGFQIFLPFLVLDFVVSTVTVSMGMLMLPPTMISFPLKLILFVMVDGWSMVVGMLLQSFGPLI